MSIIITHYKTPALLKLCIKNIQKHCGDLDYEIIVVDSEAPSINKLLVKEDFPEVIYLGFKENVGYARIVNAGIKIARGEFILILNADILVIEKSVQKMLELMKNNPEFGLVGPRLLNFNNVPQNSCFRFYTPFTILYRRTFLGKLLWGKRALDKFLYKDELTDLNVIASEATSLESDSGETKQSRGNEVTRANNGIASVVTLSRNDELYLEVDWLMGSALMTRREAIEKVGLIDERFFMYFEDVDWAKRFWNNGYKVVYFSSCYMYHYHQKASSKKGGIYDILVNKYTRAHIKSAIKYFWKHGIR